MAEALGGFNFDLVQRNALLEQKGMKGPGFTKTGTTIAGIIFKVRELSQVAGGCAVGWARGGQGIRGLQRHAW